MGLFIVEIFIPLTQWGKPLNVVDQSKTAANLFKYESSKGHHCGIYIFIQKKLKIRPALKQIITVVSVQIIFFFLFKSKSHKSFIINWVLFLLHQLTTRGQGSLSSVIQFAFFFNFLFKMLKPFSSLPYDLIWRTMLCAFHVETEVDQGDVCFSERGFFCFSPCKIQELREGNYPPLLPLNL